MQWLSLNSNCILILELGKDDIEYWQEKSVASRMKKFLHEI